MEFHAGFPVCTSSHELEVMNVKTLLWSIIGGVAITVLTGLLPNSPYPWLGATFYGYPMQWLTKSVLSPEYFPWRIIPTGLIADLFAWWTVILAALFALTKVKK